MFSIGPAGTGKTYLGARWAIRQVLDGAKDRLVITRPTTSKPKHKLGYRPGNQDEKVEDWLIPVLDAVRDECGMATMDRLRKSGHICFAAFETMKGRTFRDAVVILDEAEDCDVDDLKLFLTRTGENTQIIVDGDVDQVSPGMDSGYGQIIDMIGRHGIDAAVIRFTDADVVRSEAAAAWVRAFRAEKADT